MDHAATSWPKPPQVAQAMSDFLLYSGGNPGRSGHKLSIAAGRAVYDTRDLVAQLFNAYDPLRVILLPNVTYALNLVIRGYLRPGDHVVTTSIEHNSVMRPLRALERSGLALTVVPCGPDGLLDPALLRAAVRYDTRLVVMTHASNVMGAITPVAEAAEIAHAKGALLLVDRAQTAGVLPIDMQSLGIDLLAFTGHKGLLGPTGTGGLILSESVNEDEIEPQVAGGTGSNSEFEEQPGMLPDKYESGTVNSVGIAGLGEGIRHVMARGIATIRRHEVALTRRLIEGLRSLPRVTVYGPNDATLRTAVVSFTVRGMRVSEVGYALDEEHEILCRVGLHCAPAAHRTIGTFPEGTVRLAPGLSTSLADVEATIAAVKEIVTT